MKTIAVIFGGRSTEHDVSIVTAIASIIKPLELTKQYHIEPIYIAKDGSWYWDEQLKDIELFSSGEIEDFMRRAPKVHLLFDNGLTLVKSSQFAGRKMYKKIDLVFPAMHGTHGEDGELMGLLEMANVPYVGCDMPSSVIAMDKVLSKQIAEANGIESNRWIWFYSKDLTRTTKNILISIKKLVYPLFVKPAHLGSSIGISKVQNEAERELDHAPRIRIGRIEDSDTFLRTCGKVDLIRADTECPYSHQFRGAFDKRTGDGITRADADRDRVAEFFRGDALECFRRYAHDIIAGCEYLVCRRMDTVEQNDFWLLSPDEDAGRNVS